MIRLLECAYYNSAKRALQQCKFEEKQGYQSERSVDLLQQDHDGHLIGQAGHARYPEISSIELLKARQAIMKFENLIMHPISSATALTCASTLLKKHSTSVVFASTVNLTNFGFKNVIANVE
jgi:hypothetical protein